MRRTRLNAAIVFGFDALVFGQGSLVPDFIPAVPRARYTLLFGNFEYDARQGRHSLMYVVIPPFGGQLYIFEQNRWIWLD